MKYYIEIDTGGVEAQGFEHLGWLNYGTIIAEGDSLEECLNTASVDLVDQDGGNPKFSPIPAERDWMLDLIRTKFYKKYPNGIRSEAV